MPKDKSSLPEHIAIIMDGNGRWAKKRLMPRVLGHAKGAKRVIEVIQACSEKGIKYLTLFAFGRENWQRPKEEVSSLMQLLSEQVNKAAKKLGEQNIKIRFLGDRTRIADNLMQQIEEIEQITINNTGLFLSVAIDYSGTFDILQATNRMIEANESQPITESVFEKYLLTYPVPAPELFIRTSGVIRLSNFMLWQLAYSELYFTKTMWPDFDKAALDKAITWFATKERRFGKTSEQLQERNI